MDLKEELRAKAELVDQAMEQYLPQATIVPTSVHEAMRYSVFAGGKRLRPVLVLAAAEAVKGDSQKALPAACALELIHTYSLIHDDLPAMDNDDFRRGRPTNHKVYGEALAILAGDGLLTLAFEILSKPVPGITPAQLLQVIGEIAVAAGTQGMIGGQVVDMESEHKQVGTEVLEYIHAHKTGALYVASLRAGAILADATPEQLAALTDYGRYLGLAFQITDDILDIEGDSDKIGKDVGSDLKNEKVTYPSLYGLAQAKVMAKAAVDKALASLELFDAKADLLRAIATYILVRES